MRNIVSLLLTVFCALSASSQQLTVRSPNNKVSINLNNRDKASAGEWYLSVLYQGNEKNTEVIPYVDLGLSRSDQDFWKELKLLKVSKPVIVSEQYTAPHGKKSFCTNSAAEVIASFENPSKAKLNIIIRAYNDGIAFRYEFPEKQGAFVMKDEMTSYNITSQTLRWMEKWNPANEGLYSQMSDDKVQKQEWCYPALFRLKDSSCYFLVHESDLNETYCGTKLSNLQDSTKYKLTYPNPKDARGTGEPTPGISLPWKSPWRVVIVGSLADIVASTLVNDVATPSEIKNTNWIKPGLVSWNYWSSNHGTKDFKIVTAFADLAAEMNWPYTLLDWEWDSMSNGGNVADAARYIISKGVRPLIWYNSGGNHTWVSSTPKDRMLTHENRVAEFTRLKQMGFAGVKVDFFESEKQNMITYYLDILRDAAKFEMMVYFHGCLVPRGWERTYPNLMTYEGVRGAEWYNNGPEFTNTAPEHNTILPFTRNVVGAMDYTPVTFTNSQFPHLTSYGHELALSVLFESGLQHLADRPEGYQALPDVVKTFLKSVPVTWDDTRLLAGTPGRDVIVARHKGVEWYVGGISADLREKRKKIKLDFLTEGIKYKLTLIEDGVHDKAFSTQYLVVDKSGEVDVRMLRRGGFVAFLRPVDN